MNNNAHTAREHSQKKTCARDTVSLAPTRAMNISELERRATQGEAVLSSSAPTIRTSEIHASNSMRRNSANSPSRGAGSWRAWVAVESDLGISAECKCAGRLNAKFERG